MSRPHFADPAHAMRRPSELETWMRVAEAFAQRSTCQRLHVGAVVTDADMLSALGVGYNGNARGLVHCGAHGYIAETIPGGCGCVHAEVNALVKAPGLLADKRLFTTHSPCEACAKLIINAYVSNVYYRVEYRSKAGIELLQSSGVHTEHLDLPQFVTV